VIECWSYQTRPSDTGTATAWPLEFNPLLLPPPPCIVLLLVPLPFCWRCPCPILCCLSYHRGWVSMEPPCMWLRAEGGERGSLDICLQLYCRGEWRRFKGMSLRRGEQRKGGDQEGIRFTERERRDLGFYYGEQSCSQNSLVIHVTIGIERE
jgi:hypothetical protein